MASILALSKLVIKEIFRKKDFYVALILIVLILGYTSQLQFYNIQNIVRYLMEIGLTLIFMLSVFLTVSLTARQYPSEMDNRTCEVLMAKPVRRMEFMLGKFFGSLFAGAFCFFIFFGIFVVIVSTKTNVLSLNLASQTFYLFLLNLMVVAAMTSGLSYYLTTSANVTTTMIIYLMISTYGSRLKESTAQLNWFYRYFGEAFYYLLPHIEFFDLRQRFVHDWNPLSLQLIGFISIYALLYSCAFLAIGWLKFRRQPL